MAIDSYITYKCYNLWTITLKSCLCSEYNYFTVQTWPMAVNNIKIPLTYTRYDNSLKIIQIHSHKKVSQPIPSQSLERLKRKWYRDLLPT